MNDKLQPMNPSSGATLESQVKIARQFPRDTEKSLSRLAKIVTATPEVAEGMYYSLPRKNKKTGVTVFIEGPSIRFAEAAASCWGNMRTMAAVTEIGDRFVKAQAVCFDCETNYAEQEEISRRLYSQSDDMIQITSAAAISVAKRNATMRVIGRALLEPVYQQARKAAMGNRSVSNAWEQCVRAFAEYDVGPEDLLGLLNVQDPERLTDDHILRARGIYTALRDGQTTAAQILGRDAPEDGIEL